MPSEPDPILEAFIHARLRRLPPRAAPPTLIPRVQAALAARAAARWWTRPWWDWPVPARAAVLAVALTLLGALCGGPLLLGERAAAWWQPLGARATGWAAFGAGLAGSAASLAELWLELATWFLGPLVAGGLFLYAVSLGCGTALLRLAGRPTGR